MSNTTQTEKQEEILRQIRDSLNKAGRRAWISIGLQVFAIIVAILSGMLSFIFGSPIIWTLIIVIAILAVSLIYSFVSRSSSIPTFEYKDTILRHLAVAKPGLVFIIKKFGTDVMDYRINDYYDTLRYACTTIQEGKNPEFSEELWQYWQLEGAPRSSTVRT